MTSVGIVDASCGPCFAPSGAISATPKPCAWSAAPLSIGECCRSRLDRAPRSASRRCWRCAPTMPPSVTTAAHHWSPGWLSSVPVTACRRGPSPPPERGSRARPAPDPADAGSCLARMQLRLPSFSAARDRAPITVAGGGQLRARRSPAARSAPHYTAVCAIATAPSPSSARPRVPPTAAAPAPTDPALR